LSTALFEKIDCLERGLEMTSCLTQSGFKKVLYAIVVPQLIACGGSGGSGGSTTSAGTGSITLAWTAPVARANGAPISLAEIGGFRIYYGKSVASYPKTVDITDGTATTATMNDVPAGKYFIVMTTYDTEGRESRFSLEVSKTVQ
jgi:hypothetical protein